MQDCSRRLGYVVSRFRILLFSLCTSLVFSAMSYSADNNGFLSSIYMLLSQQPGCTLNYDDPTDPKYELVYRGLHYYHTDMSPSGYRLTQLTDTIFNALSESNKRKVADKLLATLFFGYAAPDLQQKIHSGNFLCSIRSSLAEKTNDMVAVENEIRNEEHFYRADNNWRPYEVFDILARFYVMEDLDMHYLHNWMAYILTQTILFSPAYELDSSHYPNISSTYNWLVLDMDDDIGMRYSTYLHMISVDNWRRFRSPEDNGREMMEIYTLDFDDDNVPRAATTLQNWFLDQDSDTLVVGLNENTIPQDLFGTTVTTGFEYYRELVKSQGFITGTVRRLVDFFFTDYDEADKQRVTDIIVSSQPATWQDILLQIVFSEEYLLHATRAKSAEELFFSLAKKLDYKNYKDTFFHFNEALDDMHQSSMKYKLGKLTRTPLDTFSFAYYHKFFRERVLMANVCGFTEETTYDDWNTFGWRPPLLGDDRFSYNPDDPEASLRSFISYLFVFMIHREPTLDEMNMFLDNMLSGEPGNRDYQWSYRLYVSEVDAEGYTCYPRRENAAEDILDYISRLSELYMFQEVQ